MNPRRLTLTGLLLLIAPLCSFGCGGSAEGEAATQARRSPLLVQKGDFVDRFVLTGEVDATDSANITVPRLPSWQTSIQWLAEDGSEVEQGDRVAELDNSNWASNLEERKLQHQISLQELEKIESESKTTIAQQQFDLISRQNDLEKARVAAEVPPEIISKRDWEERQLALRKAETETEKAKTLVESTISAADRDRSNKLLEIRKLEREMQVAEQAVATMTLRSPEAGVLILNDHPWQGRKLRSGDVVWVGFQLARIPDMATLRIAARLPDVDDRKISSGMPVLVKLDAYPDVEMHGRIRTIAPMAQEIDRASLRRAFQVSIDLDDPDADRLRPGLSARVEVTRLSVPDAVLVPREAIDPTAEKPGARVVGGGWVEVEIIGCNPQVCAVTGDLEVGSRLEPTIDTGPRS